MICVKKFEAIKNEINKLNFDYNNKILFSGIGYDFSKYKIYENVDLNTSVILGLDPKYIKDFEKKILVDHQFLCVGVIKNICIKDNKLLVVGYLNEKGVELYKEKSFKYLSISYATIISENNGKLIDQKIIEISLTNKPRDYECEIKLKI